MGLKVGIWALTGGCILRNPLLPPPANSLNAPFKIRSWRASVKNPRGYSYLLCSPESKTKGNRAEIAFD